MDNLNKVVEHILEAQYKGWEEGMKKKEIDRGQIKLLFEGEGIELTPF